MEKLRELWAYLRIPKTIQDEFLSGAISSGTKLRAQSTPLTFLVLYTETGIRMLKSQIALLQKEADECAQILKLVDERQNLILVSRPQVKFFLCSNGSKENDEV